MNSNDLLAKLLANENLTVVRGNVATASFQLMTRVLVLPQWKGLSEHTEEMLILHEVGHALFTPMQYVEAQKDKEKTFGHYLNVIEDARIERKMKHRYPGARKSFISGYKELMERDFFGIQGANLNEMGLIDRINLFYKAGMNCGVTFNTNEMKFINEIDKAESIDDAIDICNRLYEYCKTNAEEEAQMQLMDDLIDFEDSEDEDNGDDFDEQLNGGGYESEDEEIEEKSEVSTDGGSSRRKEHIKEELIEKKMQASTVKALEDNLESVADTNTNYQYFEPDFAYYTKDSPIVGFKQVLSEMKVDLDKGDYETYHMTKVAQTFRQENSSIVNHMVKEFEMRKSASAWKRSQTSKSGQLDAKKLFSYKIKDELFKQLTIVKDGKKHGMVLLLDWSGSMDDYLHNTISQVINLVMFARRINIPFQVFAFSGNYAREIDYLDMTENNNGLGKASQVSLLELFSNRMSEREISEMSSYLLNRIWYKSLQYSLGGTPLNEALVFMNSYMGKFIKNNSVEKAIFITLTDGEGSTIDCHNNKSIYEYSYTNNGSRVKNRSFIKDKVTGKQYEFTRDTYTQTKALLNTIKDRYNTINIGFNLMNNNYSSTDRFIKNVCGNKHINAYTIQSLIRSNKYTEITFNGYDKYYLVDNRSIGVENDVDFDNVNSEMTANQVSKAFGKVMNKHKTSRVVLSNFVVEIA